MKRKILALLAAAMVLLSCVGALALDHVDTSKSGTLTLESDILPAGIEFKLYKVAGVDAEGQYTLAAAFAGAGVDIGAMDGMSASDAEAQIDKLAAAAGTADQTATSAEGKVAFSGLTPGYYIVTAEPAIIEASDGKRYSYSFKPSAVPVPQIDTEKDVWVYDVTGVIKPQQGAEKIDIEVVKIWTGDVVSDRPEKLEIKLLCDGEPYGETITLTPDNSWTYKADNLDAAHAWTIEETDVPAGYTVSYPDSERTAQKLTLKAENTMPEKPDGPAPQTGLLWWPVALLAGGGLVLFMIGYIINRAKKDED